MARSTSESVGLPPLTPKLKNSPPNSDANIDSTGDSGGDSGGLCDGDRGGERALYIGDSVRDILNSENDFCTRRNLC